jgi:hypothetical protein
LNLPNVSQRPEAAPVVQARIGGGVPANLLNVKLPNTATKTNPSTKPTTMKLDKVANFTLMMRSVAETASRDLGGVISPAGLINQWGTESGWGTQDPKTHGKFNYGNIKAFGGWTGPTVKSPNGAVWRSYDSPQAFGRDYVAFLKGNSRYKDAGLFKSKSDAEFITRLSDAGYAGGDANYTKQVKNIPQVQRRLDSMANMTWDYDANAPGRAAVTQSMATDSMTTGRSAPPVIINNNNVQAPSVSVGGSGTRSGVDNPIDNTPLIERMFR